MRLSDCYVLQELFRTLRKLNFMGFKSMYVIFTDEWNKPLDDGGHSVPYKARIEIWDDYGFQPIYEKVVLIDR